MEKALSGYSNWKLRYKRIKFLVDMKLQMDEELRELPKCNEEKINAVYKAIDEALKDEIVSL